MEENAQRGAEKLTDLFLGIFNGSTTGREAVAQLVLEIARIRLQKALTSAAEGGGAAGTAISFLGRLLGGGFASGGYTGPGGRLDPAGIVHAGEYVFSAPAVDKLGVARLELLHRAAKGYATGGLVQPEPEMTARAFPVATPQAPRLPAPVVNVKNVNVFDPAEVVSQALATQAGERVLLNFMSRNARAIRSAVSG